nr:hypothetical protein [Tanacetum cinerariifolium]
MYNLADIRDKGDAGGEDIARSLATSESVHAGIGTGAGMEILAVVWCAGCGGGVAADSSVSNGSVSSADGTCLVLTHNEAGTEADNYNQIENHFHMNHTSKSRMRGVEGDIKELDQQSFKRQNTDGLSEEELQQMMVLLPKEWMNVEALQTKYPIIDWEIYIKDLRKY